MRPGNIISIGHFQKLSLHYTFVSLWRETFLHKFLGMSFQHNPLKKINIRSRVICQQWNGETVKSLEANLDIQFINKAVNWSKKIANAVKEIITCPLGMESFYA